MLGAIAAGVAGLAGTAYNLYTNKRDYDYQKALQQEIFAREDTAVQRRKADLEAAGFNPALAMGQAAGAGSVVSRSNTNDINAGAYLDYINASQQIKGQRLNNQILNYDKDRVKAEAEAAQYTAMLTKHKAMKEMGIDSYPYFDKETGQVRIDNEDIFNWFDNNYMTAYNSPVIHEFNAKVKEYLWTDQRHENELTELIQSGYRLINDQQKLQLEAIKSQFQMAYDSAAFNYEMQRNAVNDLVDNVCKMIGKENESKRVKNELDKFSWSKDKWAYEQICSVIVGLANAASF